jgi:hypothetical protein
MTSYIATPTGLTAVVNGKSYTITSDNPSYTQVLDALANQEADATIEGLFKLALAVKRFSGNEIEVNEEGNELSYKGEVIHNTVVDKILEFMAQGLPATPMINFLKKLLDNPSRRSIEELYTFLAHKAMPITPDGCFLAYKGVKDNYMDVHSGTFDNSPGQVHSMPRQKVDDDFRNGCSYGFHVGSLEYATSWGPRTVLVKVDPADVVSVPSDCSCQKLRTAKYEVVADFQGAITRPLVSASRPYDSAAAPAGGSFWDKYQNDIDSDDDINERLY